MNAATKLLLLRPRGVSLVNYLRTIAGYFATWPMQELTGTTALADNVALALGRQLLVEDFTAGLWELGANTVIDDLDSFTSTSAGGVKANDPSITAGKTYTARFKGTTTSASLSIRDFAQSTTYKNIAGGGAFDEIFTFTGAGDGIFIRSADAGTTDIDWANSYIQQTGILDSRDYPGSEELSTAGDGVMDKDNWTVVNSALLTNPSPGILRITRNAVNSPGARQNNVMVVGKRYSVPTEYRSGGGTARPQLATGSSVISNGTTSTDWQPFNGEIITDSNAIQFLGIAAAGVEYVEFRLASITEANPLNGTYSGVTLAQPGAGNIPYMPFFDATTSYLGIHSAELNSAIDFGGAGTIIAFARVANAGVWTDSTFRRIVYLAVDNDNRIYLDKTSTNGQMRLSYTAGAVASTVVLSGLSSLEILMLSLTWDTAANGGLGEVKAYLGATKQGATLTNLGTWVGNLAPTTTVVGAASTAPNNVWHGGLAYDPIIATVALSQTTLQQIKAAFGVA